MADVRCPICGEPWELDTLHDEVTARHPEKPWMVVDKPRDGSSYQKDGLYHNQTIYEEYFNKVRREFTVSGCTALTSYGGGHTTANIGPKNQIFGSLMEFNGDDIDAAIGDMEDAERFGLID